MTDWNKLPPNHEGDPATRAELLRDCPAVPRTGEETAQAERDAVRLLDLHTCKVGDLNVSWADIEIKLTHDAPPLTEIVSIPSTVELGCSVAITPEEYDDFLRMLGQPPRVLPELADARHNRAKKAKP